jgi:phosphate-selective porin OprO and OprP
MSVRSAWVSVLLLILSGAAVHFTPANPRAEEPAANRSAPGLERRVRELEETVQQLRSERQPLTPFVPPFPPVPQGGQPPPVAEGDWLPRPRPFPPEAGGIPPLLSPSAEGLGLESRRAGGADDRSRVPAGTCAGWDDGFFLCSPDKKFLFRITGQLQADYRGYTDSADTTDIDTFLVRRARLGIEARLFDHYEFRLMPDFGQGQTRLLDAYGNVRYWDGFQVEAGKFKQPFSYEQLIQDRFVPTMERSLIDQLVPGRDVGVAVHGQKLLGDCLDYAVAVSNGQFNGDMDTNDSKDVNGRIAIRPFHAWGAVPVLRELQIGVSAGAGIENEPIAPNTLRTPAGVPWFRFLPDVQADGLRTRWSPEVAYFYGPFGFAAQYFRQGQEIRSDGGVLVEVPAEGFYVLATYLLTGENRTSYSEPITPLKAFDPRHPCTSPGAWELVLRVSRLRLGEDVFAPGDARLADPSRVSNGASELTFGFNWYLNRWVRTQFNWEHAWFDDPVRLSSGPQGRLKGQDTLMGRFQIVF